MVPQTLIPTGLHHCLPQSSMPNLLEQYSALFNSLDLSSKIEDSPEELAHFLIDILME